MAAPLSTCTKIEQRGVVRFLWAKTWKQRISAKKCCPCTVNIAYHVRWSIIGCRSSRKGGQVSKTNIEPVPTATKRIFRRRFPGTCETVGQVFKSVWRLCWKSNVVCMSLSQFDSFQSRFVTYLLNFPRSLHVNAFRVLKCAHSCFTTETGQCERSCILYCLYHQPLLFSMFSVVKETVGMWDQHAVCVHVCVCPSSARWGQVFTMRTTRFNINKFHILPLQHVDVFCVDLRTNSDYFPIQHRLIRFITETECVYCAVRAGYLNVMQVSCIHRVYLRIFSTKFDTNLCHWMSPQSDLTYQFPTNLSYKMADTKPLVL